MTGMAQDHKAGYAEIGNQYVTYATTLKFCIIFGNKLMLRMEKGGRVEAGSKGSALTSSLTSTVS